MIQFISGKKAERNIYYKLKGFNNFETWNSYQCGQNDDLFFLGSLYFVSKDSVELPIAAYWSDSVGYTTILMNEPGQKESIDRLIDSIADINKKRRAYTRGKWKIISTSPDSIFINAPNHPLHGKYSVTFYIDNNGCPELMMQELKYKFTLSNENYYLVFNKALNSRTRISYHWTD